MTRRDALDAADGAGFGLRRGVDTRPYAKVRQQVIEAVAALYSLT